MEGRTAHLGSPPPSFWQKAFSRSAKPKGNRYEEVGAGLPIPTSWGRPPADHVLLQGVCLSELRGCLGRVIPMLCERLGLRGEDTRPHKAETGSELERDGGLGRGWERQHRWTHLCQLQRQTASPKTCHCLRINSKAIKMDFSFNHSFLLCLAIPEPKGGRAGRAGGGVDF